jgi:hypothetical protein
MVQKSIGTRNITISPPLPRPAKGITNLVYSDVWRWCVYVLVKYICSKLMPATAAGLAKLLYRSPVANQRNAANLLQELRQICATNHTPQHFRQR